MFERQLDINKNFTPHCAIECQAHISCSHFMFADRCSLTPPAPSWNCGTEVLIVQMRDEIMWFENAFELGFCPVVFCFGGSLIIKLKRAENYTFISCMSDPVT